MKEALKSHVKDNIKACNKLDEDTNFLRKQLEKENMQLKVSNEIINELYIQTEETKKF